MFLSRRNKKAGSGPLVVSRENCPLLSSILNGRNALLQGAGHPPPVVFRFLCGDDPPLFEQDGAFCSTGGHFLVGDKQDRPPVLVEEVQ